MIIVTDNVIKRFGVFPGVKIAVVKRLMHLPSSIKQIFIDDVGITSLPRRIGASSYESMEYSVVLAKKYIKGLSYEAVNVIIIDASSGFDLGVCLAILEDINRNIGSLMDKKLRIIVIAPPLDSVEHVLARYYSFLKIMFMYDIFLNSLSNNIFTYTFIDANNPVQLLRLISEYYNTQEQPGSAILYKIKRYYLPIKDMLVLMNAINHRVKLETVLLSSKMILAVLNTLLDKAQPELWDYVKNKKWTTKDIIYKIRRGYDEIIACDDAIVRTVSENMERIKFTELLVHPRKIIELLMQGIPQKKLYERLISEIDLEKIIKDESLLPITETIIPGNENCTELMLTSHGLAAHLRKYEGFTRIVKNSVLGDEIIKLRIRRAAICGVCRESFFSRINKRIVIAYNKLSEMYSDMLFPSEIRIGSVVIDSEALVKCGLINYNAWAALGEEQRRYCPILYDKLKEAGV